MANAATSTYTERWLETSASCKGTINSLYEHGYKLTSEKHFSRPQGSKDALMSAYNKYENFLRNSYEQHKQETGNEQRIVKKGSTGRRMNFVALEWCRASSLGYLDILERLFSKHYSNRKTDRDSTQNKTLEKDWHELCHYIEELSSLYKEENHRNDPHNVRIFVLGSILLHKIERTYRFQLANIYSQAQLQLKDANTPFLTELAQIYWGRFSDEPGILFGGISQSGTKTSFLNESYDTLSYSRQIRMIYETQTPEELQNELMREILNRRAMIDIMFILHKVFPIEQAKSWDQSTFDEAAWFYHHHYPIVQSFKDAPPLFFKSGYDDSQVHQYYDYFHKIYCTLYDLPGSPLKKEYNILKTS